MDDSILFQICEEIRSELYTQPDYAYTPRTLLNRICRYNSHFRSADISAAMCHMLLMDEIELSDSRELRIA